MKKVNDILDAAAADGRRQLSEYRSKQLLSAYGIPVTREELVSSRDEALSAAARIGYPVVLKACSDEIAHKTESGLIAVDLRDEEELAAAFARMQESIENHPVDFLVQELVAGSRELVMGMTRDAQFGPCVMFGLGGIFTEALGDVSFRAAPLSRVDAFEMMQEIRGKKILSDFRGMPAADLKALAECLLALGEIGLQHERIREIDINPLILRGKSPIAVDALIVLNG
ncbi:MAG: carboxylate--amine ligase [Desulfobacteraceae bacterium]|nr:MAG: carboxylate--amine ligase [Desulfobacteraceae bacterium]